MNGAFHGGNGKTGQYGLIALPRLGLEADEAPGNYARGCSVSTFLSCHPYRTVPTIPNRCLPHMV